MNKKYSPFIYFAGGLEGGAEKPDEKDHEAAKEQGSENPESAKEDARKKAEAMTGSAREGLTELKSQAEEEKEKEIKKGNIDEAMAVDIYDNMIDNARKTIDFFSKMEKNYDKNKKKLDAAFIAAGGDPERTTMAGEKAKPSSLLMDGPPSDTSGRESYKWIIEELNAVNDQNHLQGLIDLSQDKRYWKKFSSGFLALNTRSRAAKKAFETA